MLSIDNSFFAWIYFCVTYQGCFTYFGSGKLTVLLFWQFIYSCRRIGFTIFQHTLIFKNKKSFKIQNYWKKYYLNVMFMCVHKINFITHRSIVHKKEKLQIHLISREFTHLYQIQNSLLIYITYTSILVVYILVGIYSVYIYYI